MKIKIQSIKDRGDLENERVVLKVIADGDIGRYLLAVGRYSDENSVSTEFVQVFWFPDKSVKEGDFVVLFTKDGKRTEYGNKSESTTHAFYLGRSAPIWSDSASAAILFELGNWQAKKAASPG